MLYSTIYSPYICYIPITFQYMRKPQRFLFRVFIFSYYFTNVFNDAYHVFLLNQQDNLKVIRKKHKLSQEKLASMLGIKRSRYKHYETAKSYG